jgi:hypothetical protein
LIALKLLFHARLGTDNKKDAESQSVLCGGEADWRQDAELVFALEQGVRMGYRGFYGCVAG